MGKEQAKSRNGHSIFEISSLIQKALRRSDKEMAMYAAVEMIPKYRNYLWKRLLTVSAEDCHDMVTHKIIYLREKDICGINGYSNGSIEEALSILLAAQKNRDADFYACNLLNSRTRIDFPPEYGKEEFDAQSATKNGHNVYWLRDAFNRAVSQIDYVRARHAANEIRVYYPNFCWDMITTKANTLGYPELMKEVAALKKADKITNFDNTLLFRSKAILLIIGSIKDGTTDNFIDNTADRIAINLSEAPIRKLILPDYVYDCHTYIGKARGKTKHEFVTTEQAALTPFKSGVFDHASWDKFFFMCDNGFWIDKYIPRPSEERVKEIENNQTSLF